MRAAIFDRIEPKLPSGLPFRSVQMCSRRAATALLLVLIPVVVALVFACTSLIVQAAAAPAARAVVAQKPMLALQIVAALAFWAYLLGLPLKRLFVRLAGHRTVEIDKAIVTVREGKNLRACTWTAPLNSFAGITHHVRASLSGTRHELILVHPERNKSVLVGISEHMLQEDIDRVAALLGQPVIHPR
ncbi:MAG: hypothetical protein ACR2OF_04620, partial [Hyphomicrobium sp.]